MSTIPVIWSWQEFVDRAAAPDTIPAGSGRHGDSAWAGATWLEALALARRGWSQPLPEVAVAISALREGLSDRLGVPSLAPVWDVTGGEVDVAVYLSCAPECMIDHEPRQASAQGRVVTILVPAWYEHHVPHDQVLNRGMAIAALCSAIVRVAHSVEIWSGAAYRVPARLPVQFRDRFSAVARVVSAGEPLDIGRLIFAMAHPAMLRRLWLGVWDSAEPTVAERARDQGGYGIPCECEVGDLPGERANAYVLPYLAPNQPQWQSMESAVLWCLNTFATLGLTSR
ncbi:hypothetical protein BH18ACT4_BH18ACT4_00940 [soil metagenome]